MQTTRPSFLDSDYFYWNDAGKTIREGADKGKPAEF